MKVLIVSHCFHPFIGGLEEVAFQQAKNLVERGHEVQVVTSNIGNDEKLKKVEDLDGIKVYRVSASDFLYKNFDIPQPIFNVLELYKILKELVKEVDVVHVHDRFYMSSIFATKIAKTFNKPIVLTIHVGKIAYDNTIRRFLFEINERIASYVVKNASRIISIGEEISEYIYKKFKKRSELISNAVDPNFFNPERSDDHRDKFIVLFVGRFTYKKGVDIIVDIAKKLKKENICFICIGDGPKTPEIKKTIKKEAVQNIILTGFISNKNELKEYYKNASVLIFPSRKGEASSPLVILEALASGLPVIVKDTGGHAKLIKDGKTGFIVNDSNEMIEKIKFLKENRDALEKMSLNAREYSEKFSWSKNVQKLISIYKSIV
ncbi:MAG: glycosyltransferase family 4 protein [Thermoplasmata archaeon]